MSFTYNKYGSHPYTFMIYQDEDSVNVVDSEGDTVFSGTDASTVIQQAINAIKAAGGGSIYLKYGTYTLTSKLLIDFSHISIFADIGTTLQSSLLPCFEIYGNGMDDLGRGGTAGGPPVNDIQLKNLRFYYTGPVQDGDFVYIHELQNDNKYQGDVCLENIVVRSSQTSTPSNADFVGLHLQDVIGIAHRYVSVAYFGTGFKIDRTIWQGSHNVYERCMVGYCYNGVYYPYNAGYTCETWIALKIMHTNNIGFNTGNISQCFLISPQFESCLNIGINSICHHLTVVNGEFSTISTGQAAAIYAYQSGNFVEVINSEFYNCPKAFYIWDAMTLYVFGNKYINVTTPIYRGNTSPVVLGYDTAYVTQNSGSATFSGNGTQTQFTIAHGLAGTPKVVNVTPASNDAKGSFYVTTDATNIYVNYATAPPSGINNVVLYWSASM
jgi:hypothetical protein